MKTKKIPLNRALAERLNEIHAPGDLTQWPGQVWELFYQRGYILVVYHNHPDTPGKTAIAMYAPDHGKPTS